MFIVMNKRRSSGYIRKIIISVITVTAAVSAAVILNRLTAYVIMPAVFLPAYSAPSDKTTEDASGIRIVQSGRRISVYNADRKIWKLEPEVAAQDFLFEDIDHDGKKDLLVLCWKRGRFGKHRPTWVKNDETGYSQHIFIYEVGRDLVRPKWMASDIGMQARSIEFDDGMLFITETDGDVTKWRWNTWGLDKM